MTNSMSLLPSKLPTLKSTVEITEDGFDFTGNPTWIIHDTCNDQYFHIGWKQHEILKQWSNISPEELVNKVNKLSTCRATIQDISEVVTFLGKHALIDLPSHALQKIRKEQEEATKTHWLLALAKNYLFFRLPLIKPNDFLDKILPYTLWLFNRGFVSIMSIIGMIGIIMIINSWDSYSSTFLQLLSFEYIFFYVLAIIISKICHEFAHALACKRLGLKVPVMGVAFLILIPMLYTDTTESWKVKDNQKRITIALAGIWAEVCLAIVALWMWFFLPDGAIKSMCFFISSFSLLTSLLINISPFMRFDGYYVLSDILNIKNLQPRAFALTKWAIREKMFGLKASPPEFYSRSRRVFLYIYSVCTWVYRVFLFTAIALLIYNAFFKVIGVIFFVVEIFYFVVYPIIKEMFYWWKIRDQIKLNKSTKTTIVIICATVLTLILPINNTMYLPATVSYESQLIYVPENGVVIKNNMSKRSVSESEVLLTMNSPALEFQMQSIDKKIEGINWKLRNISTFSNQREQHKVFLKELAEAKSQKEALANKFRMLNIKSPMNGSITNLASGIFPEVWLQKGQAIAKVIDKTTLKITALVSADEIEYIKLEDNGYFIPDNYLVPSIPVKVEKILSSEANIERYDSNQQKKQQYLSYLVPTSSYHDSLLGGSIATRKTKEGTSEPEQTVYQINFSKNTEESYSLNKVERGVIKVKTSYYSLASFIYNRIVSLLISELSA